MSQAFDALIVWADEESTDPDNVKLLSFSNVLIGVNTFLQVTDNTNTWILVIREPNRNLPLSGLDRKDPRQAEAMKRVANGTLSQGFLGGTVQMYVAKPIGMIIDGHQSSVIYRPKDSLRAVQAQEIDVITALRLPKPKKVNVIGHIEGTDISLALNQRVIDHNILTAGTIGSGKSEVTGRLASVLNAFDRCVFIFDHKPDYQDLTQPNDIGEDCFGFPEESVQYWTLGDPRPGEKIIGIPFSEVDREFLLEACLFPDPADDKQRAVWGLLFNAYAEDHKNNYWSLDEFLDWYNTQVTQVKKGGDTKEMTEFGKGLFKGATPHPAILNTAYKMACRVPKWIDRGSSGGSSLLKIKATGYTNFLEDPTVFQPAKINVINVTNCSSAEYAMFAVSLLKAQLRGRASGKIEAWITNVIDEAQDIFNGSESLRKLAIPAFAEITRKGRSKHVGSVFCVQAFTEVPDQIVQYCNTRIVMRHGAKAMAVKALDGNDYAAVQTTTFSPGDAFVQIFGSSTYVKAKMLPSPFLITKEQNPEGYGE